MDQIEEISVADTGETPVTKDHSSLRNLAFRIGRMVGELASLQLELMRAVNDTEGVQAKLIEFFSQPITGRANQTVTPWQQLSPGVQLGFDSGADVKLAIAPKLDHSRSPERCLNSVTVTYTGGSRYLCLGAWCSWLDLHGTQRFQLGIYGEPDRVVSGQAILRLPQQGGGEFDALLSSFDLRPDDRACNPSGSLRLPADREIDRERYPLLLLFFDTERDLQIRLDYINIYFA
jgi:hypothetical protein